MHMKRILSAAALGVGLIWVAVTYIGILSSFDPSASAASTKVIIDQYVDLPAGVSEAIPSVVALQRITASSPKAGTSAYQGEVASGVIISNDEVLTAGHSIMPKRSLQCDNTTISTAGAQNRLLASTEKVKTGAAIHNGQDAALVTIQPSENFKQLPRVEVADATPQMGETVYFVNFQPTADGATRTPTAQGDLAMPAVFSGTVLGQTPDGLVIATGSGKSYGHGVADTLVRRGASGGAILNRKGQLVALSVASQSLTADQSPAAIAHTYGVQLPRGQYQIAFGQVTNGQLISQLRAQQAYCSDKF